MSEKTPKEKPKETPKQEETKMSFSFKPAKEKPKRKYRKGSKYDPILDQFIKSKDTLVEVHVEGKTANYLRTQLDKRIDARNIKNVESSVSMGICYLEKVK